MNGVPGDRVALSRAFDCDSGNPARRNGLSCVTRELH